MASHRLMALTVGVVATLILSWAGPVQASDRDVPVLPTRAEPLRVDSINKRVLIYAEVNPKALNQSTPQWGVVYQGGKLNDKAILHAFCTPPGTSRRPAADRRQAGKQSDLPQFGGNHWRR